MLSNSNLEPCSHSASFSHLLQLHHVLYLLHSDLHLLYALHTNVFEMAPQVFFMPQATFVPPCALSDKAVVALVAMDADVVALQISTASEARGRKAAIDKAGVGNVGSVKRGYCEPESGVGKGRASGHTCCLCWRFGHAASSGSSKGLLRETSQSLLRESSESPLRESRIRRHRWIDILGVKQNRRSFFLSHHLRPCGGSMRRNGSRTETRGSRRCPRAITRCCHRYGAVLEELARIGQLHACMIAVPQCRLR